MFYILLIVFIVNLQNVKYSSNINVNITSSLASHILTKHY